MKFIQWLVSGSAVLVLCGALPGCKEGGKNKPTVSEETAEEREESIQAAYNPSVPGGPQKNVTSNPELQKVAEDFFTNLGIAFNRADKDKITTLVSAEAMFNLVDQAGMVKLKSQAQRKQFKAGFEMGLSQGISNFAEMMAFDDFDILRLEEIKDGELIVYVRLWDDELEIYQKMRWWLLRDREEKWAAYDYEDFDMNLRTSTLLGALLSGNMSTKAPWYDSFLVLMQKFQNMGTTGMLETLPTMEGDIDKVLAQKPPKELVPFVRLLKTSIFLLDEDFEEGLKEVDRIAAIAPNLPILHYQRGSCYLGLEKWDEAILHFGKYGDILGWDSDVFEMVGEGYYGKDDLPKALEMAEKGLADNPNAWGCLLTFAIVVPEDRWGEVKRHVDNTSDPEGAYEAVIDYTLEMETLEVGKAIMAMLKKDFPESDLIEFYEEEFGTSKPAESAVQETP